MRSTGLQMRTIGLASGRAQLSYAERAAVEKSALEGFSEEREWGGGECRQILRDWFPRLLGRVDGFILRKKSVAGGSPLEE